MINEKLFNPHRVKGKHNFSTKRTASDEIQSYYTIAGDEKCMIRSS